MERAPATGTDGSARPATPRVRLMQITHDLGIGGLPRVVETLCRTIDRSRFDVSVLCLRTKGPLAADLEEAGIRVLTPGEEADRADRLRFLKVARVLRAHRIDVIHTHNAEPFVDGTLGAVLARTPTRVHTDHGRQFPDRWRYMAAENLISRLVFRVVGVSEETSSNLIRYERLPRRKVLTIPNGIDPTPYRIAIDVAAKRRALGIDGAGPVIGVAARLEAPKGIEHLIRAMPLLLECVPGATLVIAGDGSLRRELEGVVAQIGLNEHVRFLGMRRDVPELLQVFTACALPSVSEGLPMVLLEALAAGCPVVATAVGGIPGALTHGINGSLIPPADPRALADGLARVLSDDAIRRRYRDEGRKTFDERFSAEAMTRRYEALYQRRDPTPVTPRRAEAES